MAADLLARGLAAKSWAGVRARSVTFEEFGAAGVGDDRPAIQRAIDFAAANGIVEVTTRLPRIELWEPLRTAPLAAPLAQFYADRTLLIPVYDALDLDFAGARVTLKGPGGGPRFPGQAVSDGVWLGGFVTLGGAIQRLRLANLEADGGFAGDTVNQDDVNLTDKGFMAQDLGDNALGAGAGVQRIEMDNVVLRGFAGEIMYDNSSALHLSRDCHFYNSGHSCWNPNGLGRVAAHNLQAGVARQVAEVVGGKGHTYIGGRFYKCGNGGATFIGGPDPAFGATYGEPVRRLDAPPPYLQFIGTRFEDFANYIYIASYIHGSVVLVDAGLFVSSGFASSEWPKDIDLDVVAQADRQGGYFPVSVYGPTAAQVAGGARKTSNVAIRLHCSKTTDGGGHLKGLGLFNLVDAGSCAFEVSGFGAGCWASAGHGEAGFRQPLVKLGAWCATGLPLNGDFLYFAADQAWTVSSAGVTLFPQVGGLLNLTINTVPKYVSGQRFRFMHGGSGGGGDAAIRFARNGAGLRLVADRILYANGDYLELEYYETGEAWVEVGYVGQAPGIITEAGTARTAQLADAEAYLRFTSAAAVTFTIPADATADFAVGTTIEVEQAGAGALTLAPAAGVTLSSRGADLTLAGQYAVGFVRKVAANAWIAGGDL